MIQEAPTGPVPINIGVQKQVGRGSHGSCEASVNLKVDLHGGDNNGNGEHGVLCHGNQNQFVTAGFPR